MTILRLIAILLLSANAIIGFRFFLNVIHVLKTSRYSPAATAIYAFLFSGLAIAGFYYLFFNPNIKLALWISIAPWALITIGLFITMLTSDYK